MEKINKYITKWDNIIKEAYNALESNDFSTYEALMESAHETYENYKRDRSLVYECTNFGLANYIFEDALPQLFKNNKVAVKEFMTLVKEDKNLKTQLKFYTAMKNYNDSLDAEKYLTEMVELTSSDINPKTLQESNDKINDLIKKHEIKPNTRVSDEIVGLYESCDYLLKNKRKLTNLSQVNEAFNNVVSYMKKNPSTKINETKNNFNSLVEEFEKKYGNMLSEAERDFVKEITMSKEADRNNKKEKLFNNLKTECLNIIDKLIKESNQDDANGLEAIKEQITSKSFCHETLVQDVAKLLEIRDILLN